jgi:hypothetical protein
MSSEIKITRRMDRILVRWDDSAVLDIAIQWGITSTRNGNLEIASRDRSEENEYAFTYKILFKFAIESDMLEQEKEFILPMNDYKSEDSFVSNIVASIHALIEKIGRMNAQLIRALVDMIDPFFDAIKFRWDDAKHNYITVTQTFQQPVIMSLSAFRAAGIKNEKTIKIADKEN